MSTESAEIKEGIEDAAAQTSQTPQEVWLWQYLEGRFRRAAQDGLLTTIHLYYGMLEEEWELFQIYQSASDLCTFASACIDSRPKGYYRGKSRLTQEQVEQIARSIPNVTLRELFGDAGNIKVQPSQSDIDQREIAYQPIPKAEVTGETLRRQFPLHETPEERALRQLEEKNKAYEGAANRATEEPERWIWDTAHLEPRWVNSRKWRPRKGIDKKGMWEDSIHTFDSDGYCDPAPRGSSLPGGCQFKQYNPGVPCKHEMARQIEVGARMNNGFTPDKNCRQPTVFATAPQSMPQNTQQKVSH